MKLSATRTVAGVILTAFLLFYLSCFHYTSAHEVGIMRNRLDGSLALDTTGFNFSPPWVFVAKMETRPQRVCVESVAKVINCKLAVFRPVAYQEFVQREGFRYYWWDNRLSVNFGYTLEYRGPRDLIRGYAFNPTRQNFIHVLGNISE